MNAIIKALLVIAIAPASAFLAPNKAFRQATRERKATAMHMSVSFLLS